MKTLNQNCDLAVVGAGASGVAAAIAARENGVNNVVLIDSQGFLGGLASSAWVGTICGLYFRGTGDARFAVHGFSRYFAEQLQIMTGQSPVSYDDNLHFLPYCCASFQQLCLRLLQQAGVKICLHNRVINVNTQGEKLNNLLLQSPYEKLKLQTNAVIDCSGNSAVSRLADISLLPNSDLQAGAFVFQVSGLPDLPVSQLHYILLLSIKRGIIAGQLSSESEWISIVPGSLKNGTALLKLGMAEVCQQQSERISNYELQARSLSYKIVKYLHNHESVFNALEISAMAPELGVRSSGICCGLQTLTEKHVLNAEKPEDGVAVGAWPMEIWRGEKKPELRYFAENTCYWIPAGALVSSELDNLFFAGRNFSASEYAMASARVIGTCLSSGYASGKLAASYIGQGDWRLGITKIQQDQVWSGFSDLC